MSKATAMIYSQASNLQTRSIVWVSTDAPQGLPAAIIAGQNHNYEGWQHTTHQHHCNPEAARISFFV
jgi:hypothetical protein